MSDELINAVYANNINKIRELVAAGADINKENKYGKTPLEIAVSSGNLDMVRLLVELGADINKENKYNRTPLEIAISSGKIDMLRLLVELGDDINKENSLGKTPLYTAVIKNQINIVKLLVELGADINKIDIDGNTLLMLKIMTFNHFNTYEPLDIDMIKLLIKLGINLNVKNKDKKSAYSYSKCYPKILEVLKDAGAIVENFDEEHKLLYLSHLTSLDNISKILEAGKLYTDVDMFYKNFYTKGYTDISSWRPTYDYEGKYPGVYMTLNNHDSIEPFINYDYNTICLIFCVSLLDREDFHYNIQWNYGMISPYTIFNMSELQNEIKTNCITGQNEVVFHHAVSLKYLKEIWVTNKDVYNEVEHMLKKNSINVPIKITDKYLDDVYICEEPIKKLKPNYCILPELTDVNNIDLVKKIGKECGLTDIDYINNPKIIIKMLRQKIFSDRNITIEGIKEYLKSKGVSSDTIENLSESQLKELKNMNLVGLNFLKNYSRFDGGKGKRRKSGSKRRKTRSKRKKTEEKRRKSSRSKRRKSVRKSGGRKRRKSGSKRRKSRSKRRRSGGRKRKSGRK